jgi:predicted transcriptional regulator
MAETTTITVRIPVEVREKLDRLAKITDRSRSYLVADALAEFADDELEVLEGILEGIDDADAGRVMTSAEVQAGLDKRLAAHRATRRPRKASAR